MLSASFEYKQKVKRSSKTLFKAVLTFADGTVRNLVGDDVILGSASFSDAVSSDASFDIGAAIINQFEVTLNNYDGRFDRYDFTGSTIVPYIGVELDDGSIEWLLKGHYGIEQPESYGSSISLTALDNMRKFEVPYSEVATTYPATLQNIVRDICAYCGVVLKNANFANSSYTVRVRPADEALTCKDAISYAAQVSGNFARCDTQGRLVIDWYKTNVFESEDWLDGERFDDDSPYSSGDTADGGNFTNYSSGDTADGGNFDSNAYAHIFAMEHATFITDDVVVTGISVTAQDEEDTEESDSDGREGETALFGSVGYVISVEGNPFVEYGKASAVAAQIGERVVGMRFRPFDVSAIGDPTIEAGDPVILTDRLQNQYRSFITALTYKVGNYEAFSCGAETPSRNTATSYSAMTKAIVQMRNAIKRERTARETALENLEIGLTDSSGFHMTQEVQDDNSIIYYMHDKPTLKESQIVWKLTANAFAISTDGGKTYSYGIDVNGDAILNRVYAIGLDASYITSGAISISNGNTEVFKADVNAGTFMVNTENFKVTPEGVITATSGTIGGFTIADTKLYNGMTLISSMTKGVYIGIDGIATANGSSSLRLSSGALRGYQEDELASVIAPTLTLKDKNTGEVYARGVAIYGGAISFHVGHICVKDPDTEADIVIEGANNHKTTHFLTTTSPGKWNEQKESTSPYPIVVVKREERDICGLNVGKNDTQVCTRTFYSSSQVDSLLSGKANSNHTHSEYAASNHSHDYNSISNAPTFTLSGSTLDIMKWF